jgi:hypothetical protein
VELVNADRMPDAHDILLQGIRYFAVAAQHPRNVKLTGNGLGSECGCWTERDKSLQTGGCDCDISDSVTRPGTGRLDKLAANIVLGL